MNLLLALLFACSSTTERLPLLEPPVAVAAVTGTLSEAASLDAEGHPDDAVVLWSTAVDGFERDLEGWIREEHGDEVALELEYGLSRIHHEMTRAKGHPAAAVDSWNARVRALFPAEDEDEQPSS